MDFEQSFALIDRNGLLVDWDTGLEVEFGFASPPLIRGGCFCEIMRALYQHPVIQALAQTTPEATLPFISFDQWLAGFGRDRTIEYRSARGRIIVVRENVTADGNVLRVARDVTLERQSRLPLATLTPVADSSISETPAGMYVEFWRLPDGSYRFPPVTPEVMWLHGLTFTPGQEDPSQIFARVPINADFNDRMASGLAESARDLKLFSFDYSVVADDGGRRWMRQVVMPRYESDGTVHWSGILRDVSREKITEDQVEVLKSVVVHSTDGVMVLERNAAADPYSTILYVNPSFERMSGFSAAEFLGMQTVIFRDFDPDGVISGIVRQALSHDGETTAEFQMRRRDGTALWVEGRIAILQRLDKTHLRWAMIVREIGDRRRSQVELLQAKEAAEAANRAKGHFLATMSHELRTPLNAIIGFSELIEQGIGRHGWIATYNEYLRDISASGRHLLSLINTILDLSKIEAGMMELNVGAIDLNELLQSSVALIRSLAQEGGVELRVELPPLHSEVAGDFLKLKQVMINLLSNALKFTPSGGSVTVRAAVGAENAHITVEDTGCGISEADLKRVVVPFVQLENSLTRRHPGTGLGLSIAKQICELHGGGISLESEEGKGTTVLITLPLLVGRMRAVADPVHQVGT